MNPTWTGRAGVTKINVSIYVLDNFALVELARDREWYMEEQDARTIVVTHLMVSVAAPDATLKLGDKVGKVGIVHDGVRKKKNLYQSNTHI